MRVALVTVVVDVWYGSQCDSCSALLAWPNRRCDGLEVVVVKLGLPVFVWISPQTLVHHPVRSGTKCFSTHQESLLADCALPNEQRDVVLARALCIKCLAHKEWV
jgi:hypothetical protein